MENSDLILDRIRGALIGHCLGDCFGASYEFLYGQDKHNVKYKGKLRPWKVRTRAGYKNLPKGQPTDDTEMTLALLRTLIRDQKYIRKNVEISYMNWTNGITLSGDGPVYQMTLLGFNTRAILKGVKTNSGLETRRKRLIQSGKMNSQSNGTLMRSVPLSFLKFRKDFGNISRDVKITNPNKVNINCTEIYVKLLQTLYKGKNIEKILLDYSTNESIETNVKLAVKFAMKNNKSSYSKFIRKTKQDSMAGKSNGWVINPLFLGIRSILSFDSMDQLLDQFITQKRWGGPGSDVDTNAAIAGALLGAKLGYNKIMESSDMRAGWKQILSFASQADSLKFTDQPRHPDYHYQSQKDFDKLAEKSCKLFLKR